MTNDTQRERLVELIEDAVGEGWRTMCEAIADNLIIEGGVIVPPCKVGDTVYEVLPKCGYIRSLNVVGFHLGKFPDLRGHKRKEYLVCYSDYSLTHIDIDKFGKTVFATKEEAEAKLKEGAEQCHKK